METPRYDVRLSQVAPEVSERYTNLPTAYRVEDPERDRVRTSDSGRFTGWTRGADSGGTGAEAGFQVSKSADSKTRPEGVWTIRVPVAEYQTRSTGPEAKSARERSMAALPILRQVDAGVSVLVWALTADVASTVAITIRYVANLYTAPFHFILNHRRMVSETVDYPSPRVLRLLPGRDLLCNFGVRLSGLGKVSGNVSGSMSGSC